MWLRQPYHRRGAQDQRLGPVCVGGSGRVGAEYSVSGGRERGLDVLQQAQPVTSSGI